MALVALAGPLAVPLDLLPVLPYVALNHPQQLLLVPLYAEHVVGAGLHDGSGYRLLAADGVDGDNAPFQVQGLDKLGDGRCLVRLRAHPLLPEAEPVCLRPGADHVEAALHAARGRGRVPADRLAVDGHHAGDATADLVHPVAEGLLEPGRVENGEEPVQRVVGGNAAEVGKALLEVPEVVLAELLYLVPSLGAAQHGNQRDEHQFRGFVEPVLPVPAVRDTLAEYQNIHCALQYDPLVSG